MGFWNHFTDQEIRRLGEQHLSEADGETESGLGANPSHLMAMVGLCQPHTVAPEMS